jgi:hypothetical protein
MRCRYCNIALAPLRSIVDGEFCCDHHRNAFHEQAAIPETPEPAAPVAPLATEPDISPALKMLRLKFPLQPPAAQEAAPIIAPPEAQKVVNEHWKNLNQTISNRAAISYADDFRSGLDAWESRSNLTRSWSYDAAGFVRPGPLAIFKPTVDLTDYRFEFLGEIDQKAMGWVFRAQDLNNYYAMKFVVVKPGPLPLVTSSATR